MVTILTRGYSYNPLSALLLTYALGGDTWGSRLSNANIIKVFDIFVTLNFKVKILTYFNTLFTKCLVNYTFMNHELYFSRNTK